MSNNNNITPETLRRWLTDQRKVTVLDIRKAEDRAEWSIPGSIHVDAYDALKAHDPKALANVSLPVDVPVVTVCGVGKAALIAAEQLQARGIHAVALEGGMKEWSRAWNTADVSLPGSSVQVVQVRRTGKGCLSYLIVSDGEAAVLDASLDPDVYVKIAEVRGWKITRVLETHVHADHLSRSRLLAQTAGAELLLPDQNRVAFPFTPIRDGDSIKIGSLTLKALRTPGHTLESTSFLIEGHALFTGDTLFLAGVGRPDLGANKSGARERAALLYQSLRRLLGLSPITLVLPGHHSQPIAFDAQALAVTLGELTAKVPILAEPEAAFIDWILKRIPLTPPNYLEIVKLNEAGRMPAGNPADLEAGANRCAVS
jgi:glyoxylase-like metal-dependent hydrolase (beta-lactamase superfamily II)/rhodanese-related sulfurtransferase